MKKIFLISISLVFVFVSCEKEKFPNKNDLIGSWIQQTDHEFTFKVKLIFDKETMYYFTQTMVGSFFDTSSYWKDTIYTYSYGLDKNQKRLFWELKNDPSSKVSYKIRLNNKKDELTIWDLYMHIPEEPGKTVFKKVK